VDAVRREEVAVDNAPGPIHRPHVTDSARRGGARFSQGHGPGIRLTAGFGVSTRL